MKRCWLLVVAGLILIFPMLLWAADDEESSQPSDSKASDAGLGETGISEDEVAEPEAKTGNKETAEEEQPQKLTYWGSEDIEEIKKGFFFNTHFGYMMFLGDMAKTANGGVTFGAGIGYDVVDDWFSIELDALASAHEADVYFIDDNARYILKKDAKVKGDFIAVRVPLTLRVKYYPIKRLAISLGVLAGYMNNPEITKGTECRDNNGKVVACNEEGTNRKFKKDGAVHDGFAGARLGIEGYMGLRGFSMGLDLQYDYAFMSKAMGLSIMPMIKYTF